MQEKANVRLVGSGGVEAIAALNLEVGGLATGTAVLRSNDEPVVENGFHIASCEHGFVKAWRPSQGVGHIPNVSTKASIQPFDYIVCSLKNQPDIHPTVSEMIAPAVAPGHTSIALVEKGLDIELRLITAVFPINPIISGVGMIGSSETVQGYIGDDDDDNLIIGAFRNTGIPDSATEEKSGQEFVKIYSTRGKTKCSYNADVGLGANLLSLGGLGTSSRHFRPSPTY